MHIDNVTKVLIVDTAFAALPIYNYLIGSGFDVWVMGNRADDVLAQKAGANWIEQDYSKISEVEAHLDRLGIDYLVPGCTDVSIDTCILLRKASSPLDAPQSNTVLSNKSSFRQLLLLAATSESKKFMSTALHSEMQDISFPLFLEDAARIMVIVVPEHNTMSGGIFSMYSIANIARRLNLQHDYEVVLMTRPNPHNVTYLRQYNFRNSEDVYRFEQIERCQNVKELYLHIPEYATTDFVDLLSNSTLEYLKGREKLYINILNQNIDLMPEADQFINLRNLADELTQSVAHHSYFSQALADKYDLPTLLLPAYTDLSAYTPSTFDEKEKLIIYSLDYAPYKERCLKLIRKQLPDYELLEIRDITFDQYMNLATQCMFSISFGEGFDGYIAQPVHQGGIGFTVYSDDFFPSREFLKYDNFFETEEQMLEQICDKIEHFASNKQAYIDLNVALVDEYDKLYQLEDYISQVGKLINRKFEIYPKSAWKQFPNPGIYKIN